MIFPRQQSRADHDDIGESCDIVTVGRMLKAEREHQKTTLDSVSSTTRIGRTYLEAIEEGDLSRLPGIAYIRGFVRLYAAHLGMSQDEILRILDKTALNQTIIVDTSPAESHFNKQTPPNRQRWIRPALAVIILAIILSSALHFYKSETKETTTKAYEAANTPVATKQAAVPAPIDKPVEISTQASEQQTTEHAVNSSPQPGLVLRLKAVSDSRMHITIDGTISQEYQLLTGDLVEWKAEKSFQLDLDNAAAIDAELGGIQLPPFGDAGKPAHLVITGTGVQKN